MTNTKKRPDYEVYENYWKFTAAHTDINGTKFNNCLNIIVNYIDKNKKAIEKNAESSENFSGSSIYKNLQNDIVAISGFKGNDATLSARKAINQFVKIGFIKPFLLGYHPLVKQFINTTSYEKRTVLFSKIFYESSSLASDVTIDNTELKHVNFLLRTLDEVGVLTKADIIGLMVTDIRNYRKGYLDKNELELQYEYAITNGFDTRKYNQISHLTSYLSRFVDLKYDKNKEEFWFADDPTVRDKDFDRTYERDGVKYRIYKNELKALSHELYGKEVCFFDKKAYKVLIASHIKPSKFCLMEDKEDEAYDVNNGLLLNQIVDSYFDKFEVPFDDNGEMLIGSTVDEDIAKEFRSCKLDDVLLNRDRKKYLKFHREQFYEKEKEVRNV